MEEAKQQLQPQPSESESESESDMVSLEKRPGIFFIGASGVGKRTLLSRLLSVEDFGEDEDDGATSSQENKNRNQYQYQLLLARGWTIDTKYYTADVCVWMSHLHDSFSLSFSNRLAALVMVFDLTDLSTFDALQQWVSRTDITGFDILLCIGNKVDLVPSHPVHAEYRRRLHKKLGQSSADDLDDFGISETEGTSLLAEDEQPPSSHSDIRRSCLDWCTDHGIEYLEACASSADFDKCLSVDGDSQGVDRLYGALSAYMWPGMMLKSGNKVAEEPLPEKEESSEGESGYEFEYEVLSAGSAEPWDDTHGGWISANGANAEPDIKDAGQSGSQNDSIMHLERGIDHKFDQEELESSTSAPRLQDEKEAMPDGQGPDDTSSADEVTTFDFEDLEQLMSEIGNMRANLRLMPDSQRRDMAAKVAMKMAAMFGGGSDDEEEFE